MDAAVINEVFSGLFHVLYLAVILVTIFIVILDNRNPVKTMAWILVLFPAGNRMVLVLFPREEYPKGTPDYP